MAGRPAGYITHTVLPLHLPTVCDLHFQPCSRNVVHASGFCYIQHQLSLFSQRLSVTPQLTFTTQTEFRKRVFKLGEQSWLRAAWNFPGEVKELYSGCVTRVLVARLKALVCGSSKYGLCSNHPVLGLWCLNPT